MNYEDGSQVIGPMTLTDLRMLQAMAAYISTQPEKTLEFTVNLDEVLNDNITFSFETATPKDSKNTTIKIVIVENMLGGSPTESTENEGVTVEPAEPDDVREVGVGEDTPSIDVPKSSIN